MLITGEELKDFITNTIGQARTLPEEKRNIAAFLALSPADPKRYLLAAIYYQTQFDERDPIQIEYFKLAEANFKKALSLSKHDPAYLNQINFELGNLYYSYALECDADKEAEYQYLAVKHFQAIKIPFNPANPRLPQFDRQADEVQIFLESRSSIADLYQAADASRSVDFLEFKNNKKLVRNDINAIVACIEYVMRGGNEVNKLAILEPYFDLEALQAGNLVFIPNQLSLEQVYKIVRLCKDKKLISNESYINILWQLESQVENDNTFPGEHLRKKVRYQLLTTLTALYRDGNIRLSGFNTLYEKFMAKINKFRMALLAGDNKAKNVKSFMDQVVDKGIAPLYQHRRQDEHARDYTPIVGPIDHFVNTFNVVTSITRPVGKWPLYVLGTILDIVTVIPLIAKLISALYKPFNWSHSWFTGLFGTIIGEGLIGFGIGGAISLALTAIVYPIRLVASLIRRAVEVASRWSDENAAKKALHAEIKQASPLESHNLNQQALHIALGRGIQLHEKPPGNYQQDKEYKRYATGNTYSQIFKFIEPNNRPSAPPASEARPLASAPELEAEHFYQPAEADAQNPYYFPPPRL